MRRIRRASLDDQILEILNLENIISWMILFKCFGGLEDYSGHAKQTEKRRTGKRDKKTNKNLQWDIKTKLLIHAYIERSFVWD